MRTRVAFLVAAVLATTPLTSSAQSSDVYGELRWRFVGPTRAGRTRALDGVASRPNTFYIGFDNGGVWRTTDYGSNWVPLFDDQPTGSIGAIAVAPTDPSVIYVGTGAGIIRPDLATGDGMYKSTDEGATWTHLGLRDSQMIADVVVDPRDPDRLFVAALGHPYGPNEERGVFRSLDGGRSFQKVLYRDEYTSANDLVMDPSDPNTLYATLWPQQQSFRESGAFGGAGTGIFKTTDGGDTWHPLSEGLPNVIQANLAIAPSNPHLVYGMIAGTPKGEEPRSTTGVVGLYRSTDGGEHWMPVDVPEGPMDAATPHVDTRPLARIGGGDLSTLTVDPHDENVVYSATVVMWRSDDGMITFHDWHPASISEYGFGAPDPRDPDIVFGAGRGDVSRYDRRTGQISSVGPDMGPRGGPFNRNVRTMPLVWSPIDPDLLFFTSNAAWKTRDRGTSWTRISGDLSRERWEVPESAGKHAAGVEVSRQGVITALSPSPIDVNILWAGNDDGAIQVTTDGGATWTDVTPPAIEPWTRIFNIEAGHFDRGTAYAAANTMRIDDMNPHFWKTHDGGRTWSEINSGLASGAVANSIREDPRKPGLLYAATETQVWLSIDDGSRWQSLRMNMPAISVRDIQVKDDETCLCSDLVAGTHGRGFWILDNLTPLRQLADAAAAGDAFLFRPATAVRVRFGTNHPTEWTPELPHGDNPLPGGIIDYYLAGDVAGPVTLDILDSRGAAIRSLSSEDPVLEPDPAVDLEGYDRICREDPTAPNCRVPLYWPAPQMVLSTRKGMHRFSWDLRYEPIGEEPRAGGGATGAVPGRTYPRVDAPWAPPGEYTVCLTVADRTYEQPLSLRLDLRVTTSPAELEHAAALAREMYDGAVAANAAYLDARAAVGRLSDGELRAALEELAPEPRPTGGRGFFGGGGPAGPPTLNGVSASLMGAAMAMQEAEIGPTKRQVAACDAARAQLTEVMGRWEALRGRLGG